MTAKVVNVWGGPPAQAPYADVIEALEEILTMARRGEVAGFALSIIDPTGGKTSRWFAALGGPCRDHDVLAGIVLLQKRFIDAL